MNKYALVFACTLAACGGSKTTKTSTDMAMTPTGDMSMSGTDGGNTADGGTDDGGTPPVVVPMPTGTAINTTASYIYGITKTDGLIVVVDAATAEASAIDPSTGTATDIAKADAGAYVIGDVVFIGHDQDSDGNSGLGVWTKANGYHDLGVTGGQVYSSFTDGTHIGYFAGTSYNNTTNNVIGDVYVDDLEHAAPLKIVSQEMIATFAPTAQFIGGNAIVGHAPAASTDGTGTISGFNSTGGRNDLLTNTNIGYTANSTNTLIASNGTPPLVYDFTTENAITMPSDVSTVAFGNDLNAVFASTTSNTLAKVTWVGSMATEGSALASTGVSFVDSVSANDTYVLYSGDYDQTTFTTNLTIVPLAAPSSARSLADSGVAFAFFDSTGTYVLWEGASDENYAAPLYVATSASDPGTKLSDTAYGLNALTGTKYLVSDNPQSDDNYSYVSLDTFDLASPKTAPTHVETNINSYVISADSKTLYFSIVTGQYAGLYKTTL